MALKTDLDRVSRFVVIDRRTGGERTVCHTGLVSTRPSMADGRVWWTEYRRSTLFEQRVNSQLCYMDLADGVPRTAERQRNTLYPTASGEEFGWVEYNPGRPLYGRGAARRGSRTAVRNARPVGDSRIGVGRSYGGVVRPRHGRQRHVDRPHRLRRPAPDYRGGLHHPFEPAGWGRQALLRLDRLGPRRGPLLRPDGPPREYRITTSAYGSFAPAPADGGVLLTTYDRLGYRVAEQRVAADDSLLIPVTPSRLPVNLVNPPRKRWDVVNLDTVRYTRADSVGQSGEFRAKRYRKVPNLVNAHSWMPVAFNPFAAVDEHVIDLNVGLTLISQNLLSSAEAYASYGWNRHEGSLVNLGVRYFGLGVRFDLDASYGGNQLFYSLAGRDGQGNPVYQSRPAPDKYYSVGLSATRRSISSGVITRASSPSRRAGTTPTAWLPIWARSNGRTAASPTFSGSVSARGCTRFRSEPDSPTRCAWRTATSRPAGATPSARTTRSTPRTPISAT